MKFISSSTDVSPRQTLVQTHQSNGEDEPWELGVSLWG